jgi:hypothetical protein
MELRQLPNESLQIRKLKFAAKNIQKIHALILQSPRGANTEIGKLAILVRSIPALDDLIEFVRFFFRAVIPPAIPA